MLTMDTSNLNVIFISNSLMKICVLHELWKIDVNGSSESSSKVGWASGDITKMFIISELSFLFNKTSSGRESLENSSDVGSCLHGDNSKLIFFVNPDKESLGIIMEDTSSLRPVSLESA